MTRNHDIKTASPFQMREQLELVGRNYSACRDADCEHLQALGTDPIFRPCPNGHPIKFRKVEQANTFCTVAIDALISQLNGNVPGFSMQILWVAMGTDTSATVDSQTTLNAEIDRVAVAATQRLQQVGSYYKQVQTTFYVDINHGNGNLQEFALMAGPATSTPNSGISVARALYPWGNKTIADTISGVWTVTGAG